MPDKQPTRLRTLLFTPGNDEHKLERALASDADVVVADLEDSVPPAEKGQARKLVAKLLAHARTRPAFVRVNGARSGLLDDDLEAVAGVADGLVLPKAEPHEVPSVDLSVIALIETARGVRGAYDIASHPAVFSLMLGSVDLRAELRLGAGLREGLLFVRSSLIVDSAAAGIDAPIDGVYVDFRDLDGLRADAAYARTLGFRGKACIHPNQVQVVNDVFVTDESLVAEARRVVAAYDKAVRAGKGAVELDGSMVDEAVVVRARRLLREEGQTNGGC